MSREPVRRVRLGTILALLLLFTIVPLGLFAGRLVFTSWQQQQDLVNGQNVERARAVSVAVDQEVQSTITALEALATLGPIDADNLQAFHDVATRMLSLELGWQAVRLVDLDSRVVVNTATPVRGGVGARQRRLGARDPRHESARRSRRCSSIR